MTTIVDALEGRIAARQQECSAELEQTRAAMEEIRRRQKGAADRVKTCAGSISALQKKADDFENQLEQVVVAMVESNLSLEKATETARKCAEERDTAQLQADLMQRVLRRLEADLDRLTDPGRPGGPRPEIERLQRDEFKLMSRQKFWSAVQAHTAAPTNEGERHLIQRAAQDCAFTDPERAEVNEILLQISRSANLLSSWRSSIF